MSTLREIMDKVLMRASLEAGVDTNMYADDPVQQIVQSTFDNLFDMWWWPQFYTPVDTSLVLDGSTGKITTDVSSKIKRFIDIRYVWLGKNASPLPRMNLRLNPAFITRPSISPFGDPTKVFMITPLNSTDTLTLAYRTKPEPFEGDQDEVNFDDELLVLGAAYDYVNSLGLNPGAEDKLQTMYQMRLSQQMSELQQAEVAMGFGNQAPTDWNWF